MIAEVLVKHLSQFGQFSRDDERAILGIGGEVRTLRRHQDILSAGDLPQYSVVVLRGFLFRYSERPDGVRQIHSFHISTDAPSLESLHVDYMDHSLAAVADSRIGLIDHAELHALMRARPKVLDAIWRQNLVQASILREWLLRNSRLPAHTGMAHLFCEIYRRSEVAGLVEEGSCEMPVTQEMLAEALGLTAVHVNRTLQLLRETGAVDLKGGRLFVHDFDRLAEIAGFDPQYLHLRR